MNKDVSSNDIERSYTSQTLGQVVKVVTDATRGRKIERYVDLGCGYGGIAATLGKAVGASYVAGVDIDQEVIGEARTKGVDAIQHDMGREALPYDDDSFDLVTTFGVLDYFPWFDDVLIEIARVLVPGGTVAISLPNLASWHNRLSLLMGFQPRDVEISHRYVVGVNPLYDDPAPVGHIHCPTTRAFVELMSRYGFVQDELTSLRARNYGRRHVLTAMDAVVGRSPFTARRFLYVGRPSGSEPAEPTPGWWHRR